MKEREFEKFAKSFLENYFANSRQAGRTDMIDDIYKKIMESSKETFKRMESKRKESLFTNLWNKECFMDVISDDESEVRMEFLSVFYISDTNKKVVVFDISFNEYKNKKYCDSERCEFVIDFYEKDGKADFVKIFSELYNEIEELYEEKAISKKAFSKFVGFDIGCDKKCANAFDELCEILRSNGISISDTMKGIDRVSKNSAKGLHKNEDKEEGKEMKNLKEIIENIFGEEIANKATEYANKIEKELSGLKDKAEEKVEEVKPKVEEAKTKAKSVFETIIEELQNKKEDVKGSLNAMKEYVSKPKESHVPKTKSLNNVDTEFTAIDVFVVNKVHAKDEEELLDAIDKIKRNIVGCSISMNDLNDKDTCYDVSCWFKHIVESEVKTRNIFEDKVVYVDDMVFMTPISKKHIYQTYYYTAKISVEDKLDIYIKFVPSFVKLEDEDKEE